MASSQARPAVSSPRLTPDRASTMVSELINSTNELTEVKGMSNTSVGRVRPLARVLYSR